MSEAKPYLPDLMPTGVPGLDQLLEGGILRGNSLLLEGPPGSGKSTLALHMLHEGAVRYQEPGLIISFDEFPKQIYQECASRGLDLETLERSGLLRVLWTPPQRILEGFTGKNDLLDTVVREMKIQRIVIDSVTHFKRVAQSDAHLREVLGQILSYLKLRGINSILIKELERNDEQIIAFEEYLVDASMRVYNEPSPNHGENHRFLEIRKTRGQAHISGRHRFELSRIGLAVFPHLRPVDVRSRLGEPGEPARERVDFGVAGLDQMLCGGLWKGSFNLLSGYPGTGKSVLANHFVNTGLAQGQVCLLVTLDSSPRRILAQADALGMHWSDAIASNQLRILPFQPIGLSADTMLNVLLEVVATLRPARFVFDSINDLAKVEEEGNTVSDVVLLLQALLEAAGATSLLLHASEEMGGPAGAAEYDFSYLSASVIQLSMAESESELRRFAMVRKHTGSNHAKELRELTIDDAGVHIDRKATGLSGILRGQTRGALSNVALEVIPVLDQISGLLRDLLEEEDGLTPRRKGEIRDVRAGFGLLDVILREHFGITQIAEETRSIAEHQTPPE